MAFSNPVVGGTTLIREAIESPNYVVGTSGWSINRDGSAEFNDVDIRGSLTVTGIIESSNFISLSSGWQLDGVSGEAEFNGALIVQVLTATQVTAQELYTTMADGLTFILTTGQTASWTAEEWAYLGDEGYSIISLADGKAPGTTTQTTIGTSDTSISTANIINVDVIAGHAYECEILIDFRNNNSGGRITWKLWDGAVGGTQLGGTNRRFSRVTSTGAFDGEKLSFLWKATTTTTITSMNLSAVKEIVTGSAATAEVNNAYKAIVRDLGPADRISNL